MFNCMHNSYHAAPVVALVNANGNADALTDICRKEGCRPIIFDQLYTLHQSRAADPFKFALWYLTMAPAELQRVYKIKPDEPERSDLERLGELQALPMAAVDCSGGDWSMLPNWLPVIQEGEAENYLVRRLEGAG
jgi:hypothetical protein